MFKPTVNSKWRHYNGCEYIVLGFFNEHSANNDYPVMITYKGLNGNTWCRSLKDWRRSMTEIIKIYDEIGDTVMLVKTEWVLNHWRSQDLDHACEQCYPNNDYTDKGFVCYKHQAEAIEGG